MDGTIAATDRAMQHAEKAQSEQAVMQQRAADNPLYSTRGAGSPTMDLDNLFDYHAPKPDQLPRYTAIRKAAKSFAAVIVANTPKSADQTAAVRKVSEAAMTANAAIAREVHPFANRPAVFLKAVDETTIWQIARLCHEANRAYCQSIGDDSQVKWEGAPAWQRESAIKGVRFHLEHLGRGETPPASASHESWLAEKQRDGWKYGPVKDAEKKEHPCFVPYQHLPTSQRMKDYIFGGIVRAVFECFTAE